MTANQIKTLLEDIIDISEQIGIIRGQRMCHGYSQQDAITEHGLRSILHGKKQELLSVMSKMLCDKPSPRFHPPILPAGRIIKEIQEIEE